MHFRTSQTTRIELKLAGYSFHNLIFSRSCLQTVVGRRRGTEPIYVFDSRAEAANSSQLAAAAPSTRRQPRRYARLNDLAGFCRKKKEESFGICFLYCAEENYVNPLVLPAFLCYQPLKTRPHATPKIPLARSSLPAEPPSHARTNRWTATRNVRLTVRLTLLTE